MSKVIRLSDNAAISLEMAKDCFKEAFPFPKYVKISDSDIIDMALNMYISNHVNKEVSNESS